MMLSNKNRTFFGALVAAILLLLCVLVCTALGTVHIDLRVVARCLLGRAEGIDPGVRTAVTMIRLPRVLIGGVAGAGLAVAGVTMQGVFRNPLADPGVLGVSAGAGLGALIAMTTGIASFAMLPVCAFGGAMLSVAIILGIAAATRRQGGAITLVMAGMAVSALCAALTSLLLTRSNEYQVSSYIFWTMGGLANRRWEHLWIVLPPVMVALAALVAVAPRLDVLLLGDEQAQALGIRPLATRVALMLLSSLCTAVVVSVTGLIGFVGLIVPHIVRILIGPKHRRLMLVSAVGGAVFLMLCDLFVRLIGTGKGGELSVGVVTALLGAPFFLFLLLRGVRKGGGVLG